MDITNLGYFKNTQLRLGTGHLGLNTISASTNSAYNQLGLQPTRPYKLIPRFNTGLEKKAQIMLSQHRPT